MQGGEEVSTAALGKRPLALLSLLAVAGPRGLRREKAIALLWPESDDERGRNSLSQALTALRRVLRADAISSTAIDLHLNAAAIESDVQEFDAALARDDLERAVSLYE